jgi:hypothetical protein
MSCNPTSCQETTDCDCQSQTSLFAIAHDFNNPLTTVLYRVTVGGWSTGTSWGDGTNGFFYQATVSVGGSTTQTLTYVPFNGMAVGSDGDPALPQFFFIVPVDVSNGAAATTLTITACASNQMGTMITDDCGEQQYTPTCTTTLWHESYNPLVLPSVGPPPSALTDEASLEFLGTDTVSIQNTGVYPGSLILSPQTTLSAGDQTWLYNHLVFFDTNGNPYTNNVLDDCSHPSIAALTIDEAAYAVPGESTYRTKYGDTLDITGTTSPNMQYFFYTADQQQTSAIDVGAQFIYDFSSDCPGVINNVGSIASTCTSAGAAAEVGGVAGLPQIAPYAQIIPVSTQGVFTTSTSAQAGTQEIRTVSITSEEDVSLCEYALNPLAINVSDSAYNAPDYVIDDSAGDWDSFPQGLSYIVPAGFGTCASAAPFCDLTTDYVAYIPHYADTDGNFGTLNGGSTSEPLIGSFSLADEYALPEIASSTANLVQWFDNCGYGHSYGESGDSDPQLGTRQELPEPPNDGDTYQYSIVNDLGYAIVFGKECCASWYQENKNVDPPAWEPPAQIDNSYGAFIAAGQTLTYETLFSDEAMVVYDAGTGAQLFKLRLTPTGGAVYACGADDYSAGITGSGPYTVTIGAAGAQSLACGVVGLCPFGMTATQQDTTITCTTTESAFLLGVAEWAEEIASMSASVQLQAWGAAGDGGNSSGGFALTVLPTSSLTDNLYAYVGESYGASSILMSQPLSLVTEDVAADTTDPSSIGVLLIAGGGGSNGTGGDQAYGGNGGTAIANTEPSGAAVSVKGGSGESGGADAGSGGNSSGSGDGGSGNNDGTSGVGGFAHETGWNDSGSLIPPQSWSAGYGPTGPNDCSRTGGKGAGGFGGGGSGNGNCDGAGGGGGGGSWAAANSAYDSSAPTSAPSSPAGSSGAIAFVYGITLPCTASASAVSCTLQSTDSVVDLDDVQAAAQFALTAAGSSVTLDDDTPMWIRAWGGEGGENDGTLAGGDQGLAQTLTTIAYISSNYGTTQLYYYLGSVGDGSHEAGKGAASTIVSSADLSQVAACLPPTSSNCTQNILLIAGGGGGAGSDDDGGAGGQAIASFGQDATNGGAGSDDAGGGSAGVGGSANGNGDGGSAGEDGIGGMGGPVHTSGGPSTSTGWINAQPATVGTAGEGGEGKHYSGSEGEFLGGGGGGGWGGGGGGGAGGSEGHGGGGGGSYAVAATQNGSVPSATPGTTNGAVEIGFLISE